MSKRCKSKIVVTLLSVIIFLMPVLVPALASERGKKLTKENWESGHNFSRQMEELREKFFGTKQNFMNRRATKEKCPKKPPVLWCPWNPPCC